MARPSLSWAVYTIFRLIGVVFIAWALVAQFIILADDMKAYNLARERMRLTADIGDQLSHIANHGATSAKTNSASESLAMAGEKWREAMGNIASSISTFASPTSTSSSFSSGRVETGRVGGERVVTAIDAAVTGIITTGEGVLRRGRKRQNPGNESVEDEGQKMMLEEGYYDGSGVPIHPGGAVFSVFSRLLHVSILALLLCAQTGVPERMLHDHFSWLGASSTPAFLGFCQVFAREMNLIPAWGLLGVGIVNLLLGAFLRYAFRRLAKYPPPLLYFNYAHRLLYSSPPPEFYKVLFQKPLHQQRNQPGDPEAWDLSYIKELDAQTDDPRARPPTDTQAPGDERGRRDVRNASKRRDDGDAARRARGNDSLQQMSSSSHLYGEGGLEPHQDVLRGGYPTFTGNGLTDARRQVPTGVVEHGSRGEAIRFLREDGEGAGRAGPHDVDSELGRHEIDSAARQHSDRVAGEGRLKKKKDRKDRSERKTESREAKKGRSNNPPALSLHSSESEGHALREVDNRGTFGQHPPPKITQGPLPLPPTTMDEPYRPISTISTRSVVHATRDLGGRFPAPPPRSQTLPSAPSEHGGNVRLPTPPKRSATQPPPLKSPLPTVASTTPGKTEAEDAYDGVEDLHTSRPPPNDTPEVAKHEDTPHTATSSARSPLTPHLTALTSKAKVVKLGMAQGRTVSPEPPLPALPSPSAPTGGPKLDVEVENEPDDTPAPDVSSPIALSPAMPKSARRASISSIHAAPPSKEKHTLQRSSSLRLSGESPPRPKASQGVRFNLSSVEEITEPPSTETTPLSSAVEALTSPLRSAGLRIPGTKYTLSFSSMLSPSAGQGKRMNTGSIRSLADDAEGAGAGEKEKRSTMIIAWPGVSPVEHLHVNDDEVEEEKEGRPGLRARKSSDELDPTQKIRPRSMMVTNRYMPSEVMERERRRSSVNL